MTDSGNLLYEAIFVARQPIFTRDMEIWGYELLFRNGEDVRAAVIADGDQATTQVIADGFTLACQGMRQGTKALVNFPRLALVSSAPYVLPPELSVIEILETVEPDSEVLDACRELKNAGYKLALDDFVGQPGFEPLCALADIIKVDILNKTPDEVRAIVAGLVPYKAQLLAEKVENRNMFSVCAKLGFTYFQGYFFSRPEVIPGRKLSSSQVSKIKLLKEFSDPESDIGRLVDIIQTDLAISYRLLQYINSARFCLRGKIDSIQRAATMLGRDNLRQWLQVIVLSDLNSSDKAREVVRLSVQRAKFLLNISEHCITPFRSEGMFMFGLFSMLDAILDQYMDQILENIPINTEIKQALTDPDNPNAVWLSFLGELERWNWSELIRLARELRVPTHLVGTMSAKALVWTDEIMRGA